MLVEVFKAPFNVTGEVDVPARLIAVQYHNWDSKMETAMRAANPLFDTPIDGMSELMKQRIADGTHRTAIFELKE